MVEGGGVHGSGRRVGDKSSTKERHTRGFCNTKERSTGDAQVGRAAGLKGSVS